MLSVALSLCLWPATLREVLDEQVPVADFVSSFGDKAAFAVERSSTDAMLP